jgi:hypothetical protein
MNNDDRLRNTMMIAIILGLVDRRDVVVEVYDQDLEVVVSAPLSLILELKERSDEALRDFFHFVTA